MIVTDGVIESPRSLVIPEAANHAVSAQAVLRETLRSLWEVVKIEDSVINDLAALADFLRNFAALGAQRFWCTAAAPTPAARRNSWAWSPAWSMAAA